MRYYTTILGIKLELGEMRDRHLEVSVYRIKEGYHKLYKRNGYMHKSLIKEAHKRGLNINKGE